MAIPRSKAMRTRALSAFPRAISSIFGSPSRPPTPDCGHTCFTRIASVPVLQPRSSTRCPASMCAWSTRRVLSFASGIAHRISGSYSGVNHSRPRAGIYLSLFRMDYSLGRGLRLTPASTPTLMLALPSRTHLLIFAAGAGINSGSAMGLLMPYVGSALGDELLRALLEGHLARGGAEVV